ncbi:ComF family protein [Clostridium sp. DJ247]|uniref:ComF family protein n=1 Tax=Clostridium sp. DJ247 TaxID=2726188 RepID=UPI00162AECD1|nr:ComF family protein [Clostridium sp. DJ247]MBC2580587.1 ComF family protein [Clostridium sp. DJ247]
MTINPIIITGNWNEGYALDFHTISSNYLGDDAFGRPQFDTVRSDIGQLVYDLKYHQNKDKISQITDLACTFLLNWDVNKKVDIIIPIPPSRKNRPFQPVYELSKSIGKKLNIPVTCDILSKDTDLESKNVDVSQKYNAISGSISKHKKFIRTASILLIDDLFRTGATLTEACKVLRTDPNILNIYVLTMTKTRR